MNIQINTSSPEPIYRQVARQIKLAVALGQLSEGDPMPSVRELAQRLVLNPHTVFRAYSELERQGILRTRPGAGTYVAEHNPAPNDRQKRRMLASGVDRLITEAFHSGFSVEELLELITSRAKDFSLPVKERPSEES